MQGCTRRGPCRPSLPRGLTALQRLPAARQSRGQTVSGAAKAHDLDGSRLPAGHEAAPICHDLLRVSFRGRGWADLLAVLKTQLAHAPNEDAESVAVSVCVCACE